MSGEIEDKIEDIVDDVVIEDDEPEITLEPNEPGRKVVPVEVGIDELKAQLEKERQARFDAEAKARDAEAAAGRARIEVEDTNLQLLNGAINDIKKDQANYKAAIRDAMASGEYDKAADYQEAMANNAAKLMRLEEGKVAYESRPKEPTPRAANIVEDFASRLSPRSADWVRRNPDFVTDPRLNRKMIAAHEMAVADGLAADTQEYFDYIEETLRVKRPVDKVVEKESDDPVSAAAAPVQRRAAPPAAPVSRSTPSATPRANAVRLTATEREMAQMMGMTNEEYAKNKLVLIREGKLSH